jgi:hypothetical protein
VKASAGPASARELRNFGLLLGGLFALFFGLVPLWRHHGLHLWPWMLAAVLWLAALIKPTTLGYLYRGWTRLGLALGWLNTRVILTLLYAIAIVPVGVAMRIFGRDRMARKLERDRASYRVASRSRAGKDMERPF